MQDMGGIDGMVKLWHEGKVRGFSGGKTKGWAEWANRMWTRYGGGGSGICN